LTWLPFQIRCGNLFVGLGTGKTLLARALANECSNIGGKKVAFFMRKGADILNKYVFLLIHLKGFCL